MKIKELKPSTWLQELSKAEDNLEFIRCMYWLDNKQLSIPYCKVQDQLLVFVEKGCIKAIINGEEQLLSEGSITWLPPGSFRSFQYNSQFRQLNNYRVHFSLLDKKSHLCFSKTPLTLKNCWELHPFFQMLHKAHNNPYKYNVEYVKGTLLSLSSQFIHLLSHHPQNKRVLTEQQQQTVEHYIHNHISERIQPATLAKLVQFTPDYFSRIFRHTYGESPRIYLMKERIRFAASQLLETNLSIKELAYILGYLDENLFCRQFRNVMKCSPKQYRQL